MIKFLKVTAKRLSLLLIGLVLCLLLAEGVVRVLDIEPVPNPAGPRHLFVADPVLGTSLRPGFEGRHHHPEFDVSIRINSLGLRDREVEEKSKALRILFLGDSFAYGYGVENDQTFARVLGDRLNRDLPSPLCEVINASAPSYGTRHMVELFRRYRDSIQPNLVIATFLFINDLSDNVAEGFTEREGLMLTPFFARRMDRDPYLRFCAKYSDLLLLIQRSWMFYQANRRNPQAAQDREPDPEALIYSAPGIEVLRKKQTPEHERQWKATAEYLETLAWEVKAFGMQLIILILPMDYQFDPEQWSRIKAKHGYNDEHYDFDQAGRRLKEICRDLPLTVVDLAELFRRDKPDGSLYFPLNKHFTPHGHRVVGETLEKFLKEKNFIPLPEE